MQAPKKLILLATLSTIFTGAVAMESDEVRSNITEQQSVAVTIYNGNLALVKDQRKVALKSGLNDLALRDVSAQIRPETALLRSVSHAGSFSTLEQNFDFDLLTPEKMLQKYVGKTVTIVKTHPTTGAETSEKATVLSANNGVVLKMGNRIETGLPGRIVYDDVPSNLRDRPTLVTKLNNKTAGEQTVELSYLTGGLDWKADYVAELSPQENSIDLSGWVTLSNTSGASYNNAKLQLVAGDVNRVQSESSVVDIAKPKWASKSMLADTDAPMEEQALLEYHMYTLDRPTTIAENQTKQVALLSASNIPARKELVLQGANYYYSSSYGDLGQKMKVGVFVEFDNKEASQLGMPLPKGTMRMYKKDHQGNAQFVGEDHIDHTPKNETVRLKLGEAFDVTADKKQTDFKVLPSTTKSKVNFALKRVQTESNHSAYESAYEIVLKNAKKEAVTVVVKEPIPADWQMLNESHTSVKATSNTAVWKVEIPAEGKTSLNYRVLVKY